MLGELSYHVAQVNFGQSGSVHFVDLHGLVDSQNGVANGRTGKRRGVTSRDGEIAAGAFHGIRVAVPFGTRHRQGVGREQFTEPCAVAVLRDKKALGLRDLQQIASNAREADGLRGRRAFVGGGHFLQIEVIDTEEYGGSDENHSKGSHGLIVFPVRPHHKTSVRPRAEGNNGLLFSMRFSGLC